MDSSQLIELREVTTTDRIIGKGSYGQVIAVYAYGTLCAAKEIHPDLVDGVTPEELEATKRSFLTEWVNASRIHHPNVVQVLGIHCPTPEAKLPWLVVEMMECSVKAFLEKSEKDGVPLHFKISILVDISQGLEFLHGQSIVHRNLSSNNVLLTNHCIAKIGDLGVAKALENNKMKTHTQTRGTLHFMPPEALLREPHYGKPVDIFSLGCIACHIMSHEWPKPKDCSPEGGITVLTEVQKREEYLLSFAHSSFRQLVESCLDNLPEKRPHISAVNRELKDLKSSIDGQSSFATANSLELFDAVQTGKVENVKLKDALTKIEATVIEKDGILKEKDKTLQEKDKLLQRKDKEIEEKSKLLQEKVKQIQELQRSMMNSPKESNKWNTSQGETTSTTYTQQDQRILSDYFTQMIQRRPPRFQADTITLRSTDGVMTESAPSTSYGYHRSRPRDQLPSNKGDEVYHKLADTQSTAYGKATDKPRGNTSSSESPIHSKSSRPAEAKDYRFWQCACKTVNKATNSCCELCMQNCAYMAGKECLCEDCKVKMFISQENSNVCPMCKKAVSK